MLNDHFFSSPYHCCLDGASSTELHRRTYGSEVHWTTNLWSVCLLQGFTLFLSPHLCSFTWCWPYGRLVQICWRERWEIFTFSTENFYFRNIHTFILQLNRLLKWKQTVVLIWIDITFLFVSMTSLLNSEKLNVIFTFNVPSFHLEVNTYKWTIYY